VQPEDPFTTSQKGIGAVNGEVAAGVAYSRIVMKSASNNEPFISPSNGWSPLFPLPESP
jgi:hypothetical protein